MSTLMLQGTLVQFEALNIFRYGSIAKKPPFYRKLATMATRGRFCDGSISENVQGLKLYKCTKFHAFSLK